MNSIMISGRFTKGMELRKTKDGTSFLTNTIAVDYFFKGEKQVDFFTVNFWGKNAERLAQYGYRGLFVEVLGRMHSRQYEDKNGVKRTTWEITADQLEMRLEKKQTAQSDNGAVDTEELPF